MAASKGKSGKGALLKIGDGATPTEVFSTVLEIRNIGGPNISSTFDDITHMESPGNTMESIPLLIDGGELTFEANNILGDAGQAPLQDAFNNQVLHNWEIHYPQFGKKHVFAAYVSRLENNTPHNGAMRLNGGLKITGLVQLVPIS